MKAIVRHSLLRKSKKMSKNGYGFACRRLCNFKDLSDVFICRYDFFSKASGKMWFSNSWDIMKTSAWCQFRRSIYDYVRLKGFRELFTDNGRSVSTSCIWSADTYWVFDQVDFLLKDIFSHFGVVPFCLDLHVGAMFPFLAQWWQTAS